MCGICGFVSRQDIRLAQLKEMNDTMYHRGPNDSGEEIYGLKDGYSVGLAQRRLSIQDLSALGHQPMHSDNGRISVVFNGEIYNFHELREKLSAYSFCSTCDTEIIIAAYLKWGISCVDFFNGMFAIALFDREKGELYLMRDRIGKKPVYYMENGTELVFASELKPIMSFPGFEKKIKKEVISRYLYQQYINAPETIFENVYKLEPGAILKISVNSKSLALTKETWKYWDIKDVYAKQRQHMVTDYAQAKGELKELLKKATASRMIADVPLGSFLSGGYDSSLITAIAQEHSSEPVKTFSIGFQEERYNEAKYAKEVADYLGTNHTELYIDEKQMFDLVESIPKYYDEPFADSSQIPSMLVSALAREHVTVALSGDGGDEFFCGYNIYENVAQAQMLDAAGAAVHGICGLPFINKTGLSEKLPFRVRVIAENRNKETKTQFGASNYIVRAGAMVKNDGSEFPCHYEIESKYGESKWQIRRMLLDMDTYLPGDILCKVDRASMKYSLEARCPILDRDVMEYSYRIPHEYKFYKGEKKHILKDIAYDYIPKNLLDRPKVGFGVPLDKWLRGPLKEQLLSYSEKDYLEKQGIFDSAYVSNMIREYIKTGDGGPATGANYSKLSWSFFIFEQWYQYYFN
ncbi:asparagine synthase (glutamine-hydrolysing) [Kineothrix alysoides]|uniref:asparagine synthase (glutamine-hydrolyzing) n=1 Tax=Kineothrix alysoides TaxID=1469948 RepID=A0A4R1R230_9FIRM|nr:asparagine synthase (glutamine-hydrolyzing) [Kineothrix alysoides]TCL59416.1 asparagine synthase (glutamine-hydrolysing) [Kineothrix alysoides]